MIDNLNKVRIRKIKFCPVCKSERRIPFETNQTLSRQINGVKCITCGLIYMDAIVDQEDLHLLYDGYNKSRNIKDKELEKKRKKMYLLDYDYTSKFINEEQKVILDIGSGEGDFLSYFDSSFEKHAIEIDATAIRKGRAKYKEVNFYNTLDEFISTFTKKVDIVIFRGTIQYMTNLKNLVLDCEKITNNNSKLVFLATPNADSLLAHIQKENWGLFNRIEHKYCFGASQLNLLFGEKFKQIHFELPYLGTPYENYLEDLKKVIMLFEDKESVKSPFPFFGSMMNLVLQRKLG